MRSLACFALSVSEERAGATRHGAGFGAAAEVSCLSERADIMHHGEIRLFGQRTKNRDKDDCQDECQTEFGTECPA